MLVQKSFIFQLENSSPTLSMLGQQESLGGPPINQAFRTVLMSTAAFYSWGDQVGKVCGGSGPSDALCGCL